MAQYSSPRKQSYFNISSQQAPTSKSSCVRKAYIPPSQKDEFYFKKQQQSYSGSRAQEEPYQAHEANIISFRAPNGYIIDVEDGKIDIPYNMVVSGRLHIINIITNLITVGEIKFPLVSDFMTSPEHLIDNPSLDEIKEMPYIRQLPKYLATENRKFDGHEIVLFLGDNFETLNIITDFFTGEARSKCVVKNKLSPEEAYRRSAKQIAESAVAYALEHKSNLGMKALYEALWKAKIPMCANFVVSAVITICDYFDAKIVYDSSAGWGDRAIGAALSSSVERYVGTDPNLNLKIGYENIVAFFQQHRPDKYIELYHETAENFPLSECFGPPGSNTNPDFIFTSPPFFDYETYAEFTSQSIQTHPTFDVWLRNWLFPVTLRNWEYLQVNGHLVYYIGDAGGKTTGPLIKFMSRIPNAHFRGQIAVTDGRLRSAFLYVWMKTYV